MYYEEKLDKYRWFYESLLEQAVVMFANSDNDINAGIFYI